MRINVGILISVSGEETTTMEHVIKACGPGGRLEHRVSPQVVIASNPLAKGISRALQAGMLKDSIHVIEPALCSNREEWGTRLVEALKKYDVHWVCQYGWMVPSTTPQVLLDAFPNRIIRQHCAPVPEFSGEGMHDRAAHCARLLYVHRIGRDFWTEVVAQRAAPEQHDEGQILHHRFVDIDDKRDDVDALQRRVLPVGCAVQAETLEMVADGKIDADKAPPVGKIEIVQSDDEGRILKECKEYACWLFPEG